MAAGDGAGETQEAGKCEALLRVCSAPARDRLPPRSTSLPWRPGRIALLCCWRARRRRGIAAELLREFRRQPAHLAAFAKDRLQQPDLWRVWLAVGFDPIDQQVEEREGLFVGQLELHGKYRQNASIPTTPSTAETNAINIAARHRSRAVGSALIRCIRILRVISILAKSVRA